MTQTIASLFADLTTMLEDVHSIAVESQRRDNATDMSRALLSHVRLGMAMMDATLREIDQRLGDTHD